VRRILSFSVIIAVLLAAILRGGTLGDFFSLGALLLVFGVTFVGTLVSYSVGEVELAVKAYRTPHSTELSREESLHGANVFSRMSIMASGAGLTGALLGILGLVCNLDDPTKLGPAIAGSTLSIFYALLFGELMIGSMSSDCLSRGGLTGAVQRPRSFNTHRALIGLGAVLLSLCLTLVAMTPFMFANN
jgi:flagellar motor component MotA